MSSEKRALRLKETQNCDEKVYYSIQTASDLVEVIRNLKERLVVGEILVHSDKCTGCRACELACSYHHTRTFSRTTASVRVLRNEREGIMLPILREVKTHGLNVCDRCKNEKEVLCVKYCMTGALEIAKKV